MQKSKHALRGCQQALLPYGICIIPYPLYARMRYGIAWHMLSCNIVATSMDASHENATAFHLYAWALQARGVGGQWEVVAER